MHCRLSELRVFELLDGLSADLEEYVPVETQAGSIAWQHPNSATGNVTSVPDEELRYRRGRLRRSDSRLSHSTTCGL